ncbi:recombination protein NinG [Paraburkholderia phymatum]|uniref:Recombination protein NinG n=1 Tax=Paraburkholderia phymatum TaxID=148447 RepID=A0ACC6U0X7_9BURK
MIRTSLPVKKALKPKRCRHCGNSFTPISSMSRACSVPCAIALTETAKAKQAAKVKRQEKRSIREALEKTKTRGAHLKELQDAVNAYVRLRDAKDGCISCDRPATWQGQWHASHFLSVGSHPGLRFNLLNIHKACSICNKWKSGNYAGYKPKLEKKIGADQVAWLEGPAGNEPLKITVAEIKEMKALFRAKVRELKKALEEEMEAA